MPDSPAQAEIQKFEFEIWSAPDNKIYWVIHGGRSALKSIEGLQSWQYRLPRYGIIDEGILHQLVQEAEIIGLDGVARNLIQVCWDTAQALLKRYEAWWIHIDDILAFYEAVRGQSDQLINAHIKKNPELEAFRLPAISDNYRIIMQQMARVALKDALTNMKEKVS